MGPKIGWQGSSVSDNCHSPAAKLAEPGGDSMPLCMRSGMWNGVMQGATRAPLARSRTAYTEPNLGSSCTQNPVNRSAPYYLFGSWSQQVEHYCMGPSSPILLERHVITQMSTTADTENITTCLFLAEQ